MSVHLRVVDQLADHLLDLLLARKGASWLPGLHEKGHMTTGAVRSMIRSSVHSSLCAVSCSPKERSD